MRGARGRSHTRGMSEIRVNGISLYYEDHGSGDPIVCIHGTGSSAAFWADAAEELAMHGRAIVYDRRGCFRSERPDPYVTTVRQQTDDAAALIDALGAAPAIVNGRSYGGAVALDLAFRYPDRVRALVLLEPADIGLPLSEAAMRSMADVEERVLAAAETDMSTVAETLIRAVLGDGAWEASPSRRSRCSAATAQRSWPSFAAASSTSAQSNSARSSSRPCSSEPRTLHRRCTS
jgi:esterase